MRIKRCVASRPGLFNNRTLEFNEGLTIVYGRNGSGKSVLARAIIELVWGSAYPITLLKKGTWENFYLEVHLATSFDYSFIRNSDKLLSILGGNGKPEAELFRGDPATPPESMRNLLIDRLASTVNDPVLRGMYASLNADAFSAVSFIASPTDASESPPLAYDIVRYMLLQDASGFFGLYRRAYGGAAGRRAGDRLLDEFLHAEADLKEIEKKTRIIDIQQSRGDKILRERRQVENEIARIDNRITALSVERIIAGKLTMIVDNLRSVEKRIDDIGAELLDSDNLIKTIASREASIESRFPQFRDFTDQKKQNLKRLQETYREIRDIHVALDNYTSTRKARFQKAAGILALTGFGGIALIYFLVNGGLLALPIRIRMYLVTGLLGLLVLMAAVLYLPLFIPRRPRELATLLASKNVIEARLREILKENKIELVDYKLEAVYGFLLQYFEEYGEYADGLLELFKLREGLKSPDYLRALQDERRELSRSADTQREEVLADLSRLARYGSREIDEVRIRSIMEDIDREIAILDSQRQAEGKILAQLACEVDTAGNYEDELRQLRETRATAEERYGRLTARKKTMDMIGAIFEEVIDRREASQITRLARSARGKFDAITENRHITEIDDDAIIRFIRAGGRIDDLNPALAHLLLLAVKIALSDFILESGSAPPLIVDDPFIFMDDRRGENLKRLLAEAARERQIIVFTQHGSLADRSAEKEL
ncbi:MAG TPA: AAA family ATPase [Spirochaetota bacterium]|nr:AAA family ATPase [Spirochaetota bacterium]